MNCKIQKNLTLNKLINKSQTTQGDINYSPGINKNIGPKTNSAYEILVFYHLKKPLTYTQLTLHYHNRE